MAGGNVNEVVSWKLDHPPTGIRFSQNGKFLYAYDGRTIYTWSVPDFEEVDCFSVDRREQSSEGHCRFINSGSAIMLFSSDDNSEQGIHHVSVRDLNTKQQIFEGDISVETYGLLTIQLNKSEDKLLLKDCGGVFHVIDLPSCDRVRSFSFDTTQGEMYSPDESEIWAICGDDTLNGYRQYLTAFDLDSGVLVRRMSPEAGHHFDGLLLTHQNELLTVEESKLCFRSLSSWEVLRSVDMSDSLKKTWGRSHPAIASACSSPLVALSCEYNVRICIVHAEDARLVSIFEVSDDNCTQLLSFSPDGRFLALASYDVQKTVTMLDLSNLIQTS